MGKALSRKFYQTQKGMLLHWCPGCNQSHVVYTKDNEHNYPEWGYNENPEQPTFTPSITINTNVPRTIGEITNPVTYLKCHYFITNGMISFLTDCLHPLVGQTVPLPDLPDNFFIEEE